MTDRTRRRVSINSAGESLSAKERRHRSSEPTTSESTLNCAPDSIATLSVSLTSLYSQAIAPCSIQPSDATSNLTDQVTLLRFKTVGVGLPFPAFLPYSGEQCPVLGAYQCFRSGSHEMPRSLPIPCTLCFYSYPFAFFLAYRHTNRQCRA